MSGSIKELDLEIVMNNLVSFIQMITIFHSYTYIIHIYINSRFNFAIFKKILSEVCCSQNLLKEDLECIF